MKRCLQVLIALVALNIAFSCTDAVLAQRVGGYKEAATDDAEVVAAANFAVGEEGRKAETSITLASIEHAEIQVVAGINYRLCLKVATGDDEPSDVKVVVYRNLQKAYSLTSWVEESCGESASMGSPGRGLQRAR
jgi:hypothetical protein